MTAVSRRRGASKGTSSRRIATTVAAGVGVGAGGGKRQPVPDPVHDSLEGTGEQVPACREVILHGPDPHPGRGCHLAHRGPVHALAGDELDEGGGQLIAGVSPWRARHIWRHTVV